MSDLKILCPHACCLLSNSEARICRQKDFMVPPIFKKPQITTKRDLRISGLDPKVTDTQLVQFFQQVAPVLSVKIFPSFPKDDLRVAHVTFSNTKEAINARDSLHLQSLNGRPVSIMLADPDHIQTNGCSRVFVKNLGPSVDSQHLRQVFSSYGPLLSCNLVQPKGYGYVQFQNEEDALVAIKDMCYQVLGGKTIFVSPFLTKKARDEVKEAKLRKTVFIKNLSEDVDCDYLRSVFERCGRVRSVNTRADIFGQCRGTGYVTYEVEDEAVSAVEVLDRHVHDGQTWHVTRASEIKEPPREKAALISKFEQQNGQTTELYVKNICNIANDEKLEELFSQFGRITSCKVMFDHQGCNRGFGFVAFSTPEEANKAVYEMNGRMIGGKILYVSVARRKKETKSKMQVYKGFTRFSNQESVHVVPLGGSPSDLCVSVPPYPTFQTGKLVEPLHVPPVETTMDTLLVRQHNGWYLPC